MNLDQVQRLGLALSQRGWRMATAESCTGGLVADWITNLPGSSGFFLGGIVAYDNQVKISALDVPPGMLAQYGAVSEQVAQAMAEGVTRILGAQVGVSVSGVAGPGGGSVDKPVGLVWIGLHTPDGSRAYRFQWAGDRLQNKQFSAAAALRLALQAVESGQLPAGET